MGKKQILKIISNLLVVLSLIFLAVYLARNRQIPVLDIQNYSLLVSSFAFLSAGLLFDAWVFKTYLSKNGISITYMDSFIMTGRYILAKYIPGKFGIVLGKALYLAGTQPVSVGTCLQKAFIYQVFVLTASIMVSIIPLYNFVSSSSGYMIWIILLIVTGVFLFSRPSVQRYLYRIIERVTKKEIGFTISKGTTFLTVFLSLLTWSFFAVGFYLLSVSLGFTVPFRTGFLFPLASLVGILVLIAPGGLGIREGIIVLGFIYYGVPREQAISLSIYSRLWFLAGEIVFFLAALFSQRIMRIQTIKD